MDQVRQTYNAICSKYDEWTLQKPSLRLEHVEKLLANLTPDSQALELGCGAGLPVTQLLASRTRVTANDISEAMISMAEKRVPEAIYKCADMTLLEFEADSFDAVVAMYSIIHLPLEEQGNMLTKIHSWLKPGGMFLLNLSANGDDPGIWGDWFGKPMFWSSFSVSGNREMVEQAGFQIEQAKVIAESAEDQHDPDAGKSFLWIAARKLI